jgi:signal transduction histidine kinase
MIGKRLQMRLAAQKIAVKNATCLVEATPVPPSPASSTALPPNRLGQSILGEVRTRILLLYALIFGLVFLAGVPALRYLLFQQVDARVHREMAEELAIFRAFVAHKHEFQLKPQEDDSETLETLENIKSHLQGHGQGRVPQSKQDLVIFFKHYLHHRIPQDDTFLIYFIDGKFFDSSPRARPQSLSPHASLMQQWSRQTQPAQGEVEVIEPHFGKILYIVEPVQINGQTLGVFVVAHATAGEQAEAMAALTVIIQVSLLLVALALMLTWVAASQVLMPLRTLTTTAQVISETDLSQRLVVRGRGELAALATTFNDMMDRLETAFGAQRTFVNDAGHELRTPIAIIRGHLELMGNDPEEQQETLAIVMSELDRMGHLVNDMILLAKAERGDFLRLATMDAAELTHELFIKAQALAERDWQLDEQARGQVVVDRERLTEAMMNLAQNAVQHTQKADTIAIGSTIAKGKIHFWVRDTGEGIPLPDQKRIFERFARAANSRRRSEGAGLGLAIVKAIATAHSGQVLLRSKLGTGSMFTLILPLDPPQETIIYDAHSDRRR